MTRQEDALTTTTTQEIPTRTAVSTMRLIICDAHSEPATVDLIAGQRLVLGASPSSDIAIDDPMVSQSHCAVRHVGAFLEVRDLGSKNGVYIQGARVPSALVTPGGGFDLGGTRVDVAQRSEDEAQRHGDSATAAPLPSLIGASRPMLRLSATVRRIARLELPVSIRGESGTGKELVAHALHGLSRRADRGFVALNAATLTPELAESELFGHERGAFTGAVRERRGAFREAHQGTLFLDEIGALPQPVQAKLLRVVEEGCVRRLGGDGALPVDVRLLVATCEPLDEMVRLGTFRRDLFERIAVCVVDVPPLRERPEDIPSLANHLLETSLVGAHTLTPGALSLLRRQPWTGNVRELRNVLVQAAVCADGAPAIGAEHVAHVLSARSALGRRKATRRRRLSPSEAAQIFHQVGGNISAAARRANLPRTTMRDLLRQVDA